MFPFKKSLVLITTFNCLNGNRRMWEVLFEVVHYGILIIHSGDTLQSVLKIFGPKKYYILRMKYFCEHFSIKIIVFCLNENKTLVDI